MSEEATTEIKTEDVTTVEANAEPTGTEEPVRGSKAWEGLQAEAARHKREAAQYSKELEAYKQKEREIEEKKAIEEGNFKKLIEQLKSEKANLETEIYHSTVREKLRIAGMTSSLSIEGAVRNAPVDVDAAALSEWIEKIKTEHPLEFEQRPQPTPQPSPGAPSSGNAPINWEEVKAWEKSQDRDQRKKARDLLGEYRKEHGKYPY
jgi:DNA repair exonuclease SbcCD ATPase subunit